MLRHRISIALLTAVIASVSSGQSEADIVFGTSGNQTVVYEYNTATTATTHFSVSAGYTTAGGIAYGPDGDLYVAERTTSGSDYLIEKYSTSGQDLGTFASGLTASYRGIGLAFDSSGDLFATESGKIHEFYATGGGRDLTPPSSFLPYQLAVSSTGILYATDSGSNNIYEYNTTQLTPTPSVFATIPGGGGGVYVDTGGNVFVSYGSGINEYTSSGTEVGGSPFSNRSGLGLTYDSGSNSFYVVNPPWLYAVNPTTGASTPATNGFSSVEYLADAAPASPSPVPEPPTLAMALSGALGLLAFGWPRRLQTPRR